MTCPSQKAGFSCFLSGAAASAQAKKNFKALSFPPSEFLANGVSEMKDTDPVWLLCGKQGELPKGACAFLDS